MIRRPPRSTQSRSSAASDVYKRHLLDKPCLHHPLALNHRIRHYPAHERGRAYRVVVSGYYVIDLVRVTVGVDQSHDWYTQIARLRHGNPFLVRIDHEKHLG